MGHPELKDANNEDIDLEMIDRFFYFLTKNKKLSSKKAFDIIYYLQEQLEILPDRFEKCTSCKEMYDSHQQGSTHRLRQYCSSCYWDIQNH